MAQKLLNSDLAELISKMKLAQQYVMTRLVQIPRPPTSLTNNCSLLVLSTGDVYLVFFLCVLYSLQKDYKKHMLMAAHALAVDAKNLLDVIDQSRLKMIRI